MTEPRYLGIGADPKPTPAPQASPPPSPLGLRIIVTGGRDYSDGGKVFAALDKLHARSPVGVIVHGGATGADTLAGEWAKARGVAVEVFAADWERYGASAGPRRNNLMLSSGCHGVVAFPGGRGTEHCARTAKLAGFRVWRPFG